MDLHDLNLYKRLKAADEVMRIILKYKLQNETDNDIKTILKSLIECKSKKFFD